MKIICVLIISVIGLLSTGCQNSSEKSSGVVTGPTANRDGRVQALVDHLKAKGYSEARAKQIADETVPMVETTNTESLTSIFTGQAEKDRAAQKKFESDLAKAKKGQ